MEQGQKFKQIRKQRKYTIQRLSQVAGSVASISDFENNKTSLSNDTLFKLLKHLKIEYNEFFGQEYLVDKTYIKLANQYNQASNNLDFDALEQVAEKFHILGEDNYSDYLISLCITCQVSKLQNQSVNQDIATELQNYFFSIDIWTLLDIDLLDMVKDIFTEDALKIYIKELLSILGTNPRNNLDRITLDVISRCIFQIILYGNQEDSDYYLNELKTIQLPDYFMLQKLYLKELEAAYLYKYIDKNMGTSLHKEIPVYEVPVGFKYFSSLLFDGEIGIGGEESAGASFLKKDGTVWTTDKDGMVMALLAMEMYAVMGATVERLYNNIVEGCGDPRFGRIDAPCTKVAKAKLKQLNASSITATEVDGDAITNVRTTSLYKDMPIDGVRVETETGWFVARPSGTEDLYKIYGESYKGDKGLIALLTAGEEIVTSALSDEV